MYPVGRICSRLAEESRLIDHRILVLSQMAIASTSIPSLPGPSSVSVATQTVVRTYVNASVQAVSVRCMPRPEFLAKIRELVQENALTRVYALLREMRSSLEAVVAGNELVLNVELARVRNLQGAFAPIVVEGRLTPESVEGGHLTEASEEGSAEEGIDREETSL